MEVLKKIKIDISLYVIFGLIFLLFLLIGVVSLDPDFGWHITAGRYILENGIAKTDPFSYTMPSFPFVDHEWLTNVIFAKIHPVVGYLGLSFIASFLATSAIIITLWDYIFGRKKGSKIQYLLFSIPAFLGAGILVSFFGIRPQVESWFFLAVLIRVITKEKLWKKWRSLIPAFIVVWTNLHGSFAISIAVISIVAVLKSIRARKILADYFIILVLSLAATFINPYGYRLWGEVFMQLTDSALRWRILEWMPPVGFFNLSFIALLTLSTMLVARYRKKIDLEYLGLYLFFLIQGLTSSRHIPLWTVTSLPLLAYVISLLYAEVGKIKFGGERFFKLFYFLNIGVIALYLIQGLYSYYARSYLSERHFYPKSAVEYLKTDIPEGEIFSEYGWGGYLIWKLPEKRVFIDGRMPSWRWDKYDDNESSYVMEEYLDLLNGEVNYKDVFQKYNVSTVLWPVKKSENFMDKLEKKFRKFLGRYSKKNLEFDLASEIEKDGWIKVYSDATAVIYESP